MEPAATPARRVRASSRREIWRGVFSISCRMGNLFMVDVGEILTSPAGDVTIPRTGKGMLRMQSKNTVEYDAIVVGSGASGGWACKRLAEAGLKIALVDAGRTHGDEDFREHKPLFELRYRNKAPELVKKTRPVQSQLGACDEYTSDWFCNDLE